MEKKCMNGWVESDEEGKQQIYMTELRILFLNDVYDSNIYHMHALRYRHLRNKRWIIVEDKIGNLSWTLYILTQNNPKRIILLLMFDLLS